MGTCSVQTTIMFTAVCACIVAPYDVVIMGDNTYDNGDQLELHCSSEGGPDLEYSWSRTNTFLATTTTNTSTLTISDLATVDGGDYTCTVTNDAGTETMTVTVNGEFFFVCFLPFIFKTNNTFSIRQYYWFCRFM